MNNSIKSIMGLEGFAGDGLTMAAAAAACAAWFWVACCWEAFILANR